MMAHDHYHLLMSMALDGELSPEEIGGLRQHLEACRACRDAWDRFCLLNDQLRHPPSVAEPSNFTAQAMRLIAKHEIQRLDARPARLALAAIVVQFVVLIALTLGGITLLGSGDVAHGLARLTAHVRPAIELLDAAATLAETLASALVAWLGFLIEQPLVWAVAITALVLASIWVGLLEVLKPTLVPVQNNL